jgi:hypothetical protein
MRHAVLVRIAYLIAWRGGLLTGPLKKMAAQAQQWAAVGHDVGLFVTTDTVHAADWQSLPGVQAVDIADGGAVSVVRARRRSYRRLRRWQPDLIYLRHGVYAPGLGTLVKTHPTVLEINGDEVAIARQRSRLRGAWAGLTRSIVLSRAVGAVFMSDSLAGTPELARYRFGRIVIPNGVDLEATPRLPPSTERAPRLVLLGHPRSPWHGVDKLVDLALDHPTWAFDVIGPDAADLGGPPPPNMVLYPELPAERYLPLLAAADVGLGTLAMHRLGVAENPALKVREYLALGLAVIIGCRDPDFPDAEDFVLELPNTESNIADHASQIEDFVGAWHGRRVDRSSVARLDIVEKERQRLAFFERVLVGAGAGRTGQSPQ